jgi:hypothetical protein
VTVMKRSIAPAHPVSIPQGRSLAHSAFCGATPGTAGRATFVVRTATKTPRAAVATASVFGWYKSSVLVFSELFLSASISGDSGPLTSETLSSAPSETAGEARASLGNS